MPSLLASRRFTAALALALATLLIAAPPASALERSDVIAVVVERVQFEKTPPLGAIESLRATAAAAGIELSVADSASAHPVATTLTLDASGLTLDAALEFITSSCGLEWTIREGRILVFSSEDVRARWRRGQGRQLREKLGALTLGEMSFVDVPLAEAYSQVREAAIAKYGVGALPRIDSSELPEKDGPRVTATVRGADVDTLFNILAALAPDHDWTYGPTEIIIVDMETRRDLFIADADSNMDPFSVADPFSTSDAFAPSGQAAPPMFDHAAGERTDGFNTESYEHFGDNPFFSPVDEPLSTFAADVDTASYTNLRRLIGEGGAVPPDAARIEEMVNYFPYDYAVPGEDSPHPFAVHTEIAPAPWAPEHRLVRFGIKGLEVDTSDRPALNLVFLLDVSGSMSAENKLPLVIASMRKLTRGLAEQDKVAIVVYANASGLVLPATPGDQTQTIFAALNALNSGGSTNGGEGIQLAYKVAVDNFIEGGSNRVILCTDGDFNVGTTGEGSLVSLVEEKAKEGVFLTVAGFGGRNLKDSLMESISNRGNGNYFYIDRRSEADKVFVEGLLGTLVTIAKDVKLQVEFNPAHVGAYRLIGYENRLLEAQDFDDDTKDGGEIGSGHTVTALYEIIPAGLEGEWLKRISPLKYQTPRTDLPGQIGQARAELLTLKLRYKQPDGDVSTLVEIPVTDGGAGLDKSSEDFRFAAAVAAFGMVLRDSEFRGAADRTLVLQLGEAATGNDPGGHRAGFLKLVKSASSP